MRHLNRWRIFCIKRPHNRGLLPGAGTAVYASGFAVSKLNSVFAVASLPEEPRTPVRGCLFQTFRQKIYPATIACCEVILCSLWDLETPVVVHLCNILMLYHEWECRMYVRLYIHKIIYLLTLPIGKVSKRCSSSDDDSHA